MADKSNSSALERLAYTVEQAAVVSGIGRSSLYEKIKDGSLASRVVCGRRLIMADDLRAFLTGCEPKAAA
ncbi:MAG: hypothetical protein CTY20_06865 [Hyphomicrobium sp.]|nr:MAG: hypothetical protein CTY20_06865 [Hyphomicrobium sp.]